MSNADEDSTRKHLEFEDQKPEQKFELDNDPIPLTFEYSVLKRVGVAREVAKQIMSDQMKEYLSSKGLTTMDFASDEVKKIVKDIQEKSFLQLEHTGEHWKTIPFLELGTPIMVERHDENEKLQKINVIFAVVRAEKPRSDAGEIYFLAHPVDKNGLDELVVSSQNRSDETKKFQPPVWLVEPKNPFGKHQELTHIVSYPLKDR